MALQCVDFVPLSQDLWQNNKNATSCFICKSKFNIFRRRHHCRNCGIVICNNCSKHHIINTQKYRICHDCYPKIIKTSKQISNEQKSKESSNKNWINKKPKFTLNGTTKNHQQILNNFVIKGKSFKYKQDIEEAFKLWHQYRKWQNNHEWIEKQEKNDNIKIYSHSISNTNTDIIKCEMIIPYSTQTILDVLLNENHVQKWQSNNDWNVEQFTKIEKCSKYADIIYFSIKPPIVFITHRDAIVIRFIYTLEDGSILMGLRSIIHNKYPPHQTKKVRININLEFWHIMPDWENKDTSHSKIIYYSHASFGGNLPNWLINEINSKYHTSKLLQLNNYIKSIHDTLQKPPELNNVSYDSYPRMINNDGEDAAIGSKYKHNKNNTQIRKRKYLNKQKSGSNIDKKESETQHRDLVIVAFIVFCLIGFILFWRLQSAESLPLLYYIEIVGKCLFDNVWFIFSKITRTYYDILNRNLSNELNRFRFIVNMIYILISSILFGIYSVIAMIIKIALFILTSFYDNLCNNSQNIIICVNAVIICILSIIIIESFHMKLNNYHQNKYRKKVSSIINDIYHKYEAIIPYFIFLTFVLFWIIGKSLINYVYKIDGHNISNFDKFMMFTFVICVLIYITVIFSFCMMIYQSIEDTFFKSKNVDKSSGVSRKTVLNTYVDNEYEWEWMDDNYQWKPYTNNINKKINSLKNGSDSFKVKIGSYTYLIKKDVFSNIKGTQRNIKTNKIRNIRKKIINCNYNVNRRRYKNNANIISNEYKNVQDLFFQTVNKYNYEIIQIENVCNIYKDKVYEANISSKCNEYNKSREEIERLLWHGTSYANIQNILKTGFDRTYNTQSLYGKGTYFALNASYSVSYSPTNKVLYGTGSKYMLLCKVIIGDYTIGKSTQNKIAKKYDGTEYDSMVDKLNNPSIFVIWRDYHAIPKYLITFKQK